MPASKVVRMTPHQFRHWLDDNGVSGPMFCKLTGITSKWFYEVVKPKSFVKLSRRMTILMIYAHKELAKGEKGVLLCRCGCGEPTYRSHLTGYMNLYLPEHSKVFQRGLQRNQRAMAQSAAPLSECPSCKTPLRQGTFRMPKDFKMMVGKLCERCGFKQLIREAS